MACFIVPAVEAIVVESVKHNEVKKEHEGKKVEENKVALSVKLSWLTKMLWGGVILLAFEHVWHGEVVPFWPFLTAMYDPNDTSEMLSEMGSVGVTMAILVTLIWVVMCKVADHNLAKSANVEGVKA